MRAAIAVAAVLALAMTVRSAHPQLQQQGSKTPNSHLRHHRQHRKLPAGPDSNSQPAEAELDQSAQHPWSRSEPEAEPTRDLTMSRLGLGLYTDGTASGSAGADSFASAVNFLSQARLSHDSPDQGLQPDGTLSNTDAASASRLHLASPEAYGADQADQILADQATGAELGPSPNYERMPVEMFTDAHE